MLPSWPLLNFLLLLCFIHPIPRSFPVTSFVYPLSVTQSNGFRSHLYNGTLKFTLSSDFQVLISISIFPVIYHISNYIPLTNSQDPAIPQINHSTNIQVTTHFHSFCPHSQSSQLLSLANFNFIMSFFFIS